jgi:hypothetical protein
MAEVNLDYDSLRRALHHAEDQLEIEREQRLRGEIDLIAMEIRCAAALDAMASLRAAPEIRFGKKLRRVLKKG